MYANEGMNASAAKQAYEAGATLADAKRESEIEGELRRLLSAQHAVRESAAALCGRLSPVQRIGAGTIEKGQANAPMPTLCPLASALREVRMQLEVVHEMLIGNREQLEI